MDHTSDDTSEIVTRYISELLERRADAAHPSVPHTPALQRETGRRLAQDEFREEMVSRFEKLRHLAKETATCSVKVRDRRHRAQLWLISVLVLGIAGALVYSLVWIKSEMGPRGSVPLPNTAKQPAKGRESPLQSPSVPDGVTHDEPSSAVAIQARRPSPPPAALSPTTQENVRFWPMATEGLHRALRTRAFAFVASTVPEVVVEQRARRRIAALLTEAVNDKILGSPVAASVARIELKLDAAGANGAYDYTGDVLDGAGQVVGRVRGIYAIHPESLSATVLYHGDDRVEYSEGYFKGKL